jgi:hypothetical protein
MIDIQTISLVVFGFVFGYYIYAATLDPNIDTSKATLYMYGIGLPIMMILGYWFYMFIRDKYPLHSTYVALALSAVALLFLYTIWYAGLSIWSLSVLSYFSSAVFLLILVVAMALLFYIFGSSLKQSTGWGGVFVRILFYLPCLALDFIQYIKTEFQLTTRPIYILLLVESILIAFYVYLPKIVQYFSKINAIPILNGSAFLDIPQTFEVSKDILIPNAIQTSDVVEMVANRNYALSMWLFVNHYTSNTIAYNNETLLFDYGAGRPKITFVNDDPNMRDTYRIYFTNAVGMDSADRYYDLKMPGQKWNHVVFNYTSNYVDLFVNGHLERTFYLKNKQPDFSTADIVRVGATDGINGAISNIVYHKKPLTKSAISANYNILKKQSPPIIKM